jgi:sporulation protein YlmC with PRC-barrel domain
LTSIKLTSIKTGALVAALLTAAAPAALAQTPTAPVPTTPRTIVGTIQPNQLRASKMIGSTVYDQDNKDIGSLKDIVLDRDGRVAAMVVSTHDKNVALPLDDFTASHNRLTLTNIRDAQLEQAQPYHMTNDTTGAGTTQSPVNGGRLGSGAGR